jgi:DNA-binding response OmpR family regulator
MQLPDGTGFDVSEIFKNTATSVIFLTVVDDENTIVRAFDEGAQDYIVKPFRIRELLARVRRILSVNIKNGEKDNIIYMGHAAIHTDEAKVYVNDKSIELTALEYRLLLIFASNKGLLLTRQQILDKIWDADGNFVEDNTLTVYVKRLREKLGEAIHIETVFWMTSSNFAVSIKEARCQRKSSGGQTSDVCRSIHTVQCERSVLHI